MKASDVLAACGTVYTVEGLEGRQDIHKHIHLIYIYTLLYCILWKYWMQIEGNSKLLRWSSTGDGIKRMNLMHFYAHANINILSEWSTSRVSRNNWMSLPPAFLFKCNNWFNYTETKIERNRRVHTHSCRCTYYHYYHNIIIIKFGTEKQNFLFVFIGANLSQCIRDPGQFHCHFVYSTRVSGRAWTTEMFVENWHLIEPNARYHSMVLHWLV